MDCVEDTVVALQTVAAVLCGGGGGYVFDGDEIGLIVGTGHVADGEGTLRGALGAHPIGKGEGVDGFRSHGETQNLGVAHSGTAAGGHGDTVGALDGVPVGAAANNVGDVVLVGTGGVAFPAVGQDAVGTAVGGGSKAFEALADGIEGGEMATDGLETETVGVVAAVLSVADALHPAVVFRVGVEAVDGGVVGADGVVAVGGGGLTDLAVGYDVGGA